MIQQNVVDHLFRHQHGKMVAILTRIFGFEHLEMIEDAVQDTFITAMKAWNKAMPENPEAWLTQAAKNRALDLLRKLNAEQERLPKIESGPSSIAIQELFLEGEIADSQLRMIFAACHPELNAKDQIAFALKTISGFSQKEIAASLLLKEDTVKKRLSRARKTIIEKGLEFKIPNNEQLPARLDRVQQVLYLIFNEGFHSIQQAYLVREDLCAEAMRLCKMLLQNPLTQQPSVHAHFALMCFNLARLNSKTNTKGEVISLKEQDRTSWDHHLVTLGHFNMGLAVETKTFSSYHFEAAIAAEHVSAKTWNNTNWQNILQWYDQLNAVQPSPFNDLNRAVIFVHLNDFDKAKQTLMAVEPTSLEQRAYLYYGLWAEFFYKSGLKAKALANVNKAISMVSNKAEKEYLLGKKAKYLTL